jgi:hypothetical protein
MHCAMQLMVRWHCPGQHSSGEPENITELSGVIGFYPSICQLGPGRTKHGPKMHSNKVCNNPTHPNSTVGQCLLITLSVA